MSPRQMLFLKIGCWIAFVTAAMHMVVQISGGPPPANDDERTLMHLVTTYRFALPGGAQRTMEEYMNGFGLLFAVQLATMGGIGLIVAKRARADVMLTAAVVRVYAVISLAMLGISISHFFIIPTICIGLMAGAFVLATIGRARDM